MKRFTDVLVPYLLTHLAVYGLALWGGFLICSGAPVRGLLTAGAALLGMFGLAGQVVRLQDDRDEGIGRADRERAGHTRRLSEVVGRAWEQGKELAALRETNAELVDMATKTPVMKRRSSKYPTPAALAIRSILPQISWGPGGRRSIPSAPEVLLNDDEKTKSWGPDRALRALEFEEENRS